jgi:O-antigen ligase
MNELISSFKKDNLYINIFKLMLLLWIVSIPFKNAVYQVSTVLIFLYFIVDIIVYRDFNILKVNFIKVKLLSIGFIFIIISMSIANFMNPNYLTENSWSEMYKFVARFGIIFVALSYFYTKEYFSKEFIVKSLIVSFSFIMLIGLYQVVQNPNVVIKGYGIIGTLDNRNAFGLMMGMAVTFTYVLISKNKVYLIPLLMLFLFSMIFSFSRSSWVASTVSLCILIIFNYKKIKSIHLLYFLFMLCFLLVLYFNIDSFQHRFQQLLEGNSSNRTTIWMHTISLIKGNFIFGYGLESWPNLNDSYLNKFPDPHNLILEILVYTGFVGLISVLFTIFIIIKNIITSKQYFLLPIASFFLIVTQFDFGAFGSKELLSFLTIFVLYIYADIFRGNNAN